jgi:hypothetical protein
MQCCVFFLFVLHCRCVCLVKWLAISLIHIIEANGKRVRFISNTLHSPHKTHKYTNTLLSRIHLPSPSIMEVKLVIAKIASFLPRKERLACKLVSSAFRNTIDTDLDAWGLFSLFAMIDTTQNVLPFKNPYLNVILCRERQAVVDNFKRKFRGISEIAVASNLPLQWHHPFELDDGEHSQLREITIGYSSLRLFIIHQQTNCVVLNQAPMYLSSYKAKLCMGFIVCSHIFLVLYTAPPEDFVC